MVFATSPHDPGTGCVGVTPGRMQIAARPPVLEQRKSCQSNLYLNDNACEFEISAIL